MYFKGVTQMNRLKELREERKWSMRDAAKFLKKPYTTYVNHEKGYRELRSEDIRDYAKAYEVSIDDLLGRTNIKMPTTPKDGEREEEYEEFYYNVLSKLSQENLAFLKAQGQFLLDHQKSQDGQG